MGALIPQVTTHLVTHGEHVSVSVSSPFAHGYFHIPGEQCPRIQALQKAFCGVARYGMSLCGMPARDHTSGQHTDSWPNSLHPWSQSTRQSLLNLVGGLAFPWFGPIADSSTLTSVEPPLQTYC